MLYGPFHDQTQCTRWKLTGQYQKGLKSDFHLEITIPSMKMRWIMLIKVHGDYDTEKPTNLILKVK